MRHHGWLILFTVQAFPLCMPVARAQDATACSLAARAAEQQFGIPEGLLDKIGHVESGRGSAGAAWPWTINADGRGQFFDSRTDALLQIARLQTRGARLIDVSCFQMDLFWHPDAFTSLDDALNPMRNAQEAARFLANLHSQTSDWSSAVARYHSASQILGSAYRDRVLGVGSIPATMAENRISDPFVIALGPRSSHSAAKLPNVIRATIR